MEEWRFVFEDNTEQSTGISSGIIDSLGSGTTEKSKVKKDNTFTDIVAKKGSEKLFEQTIISPLNTMTGGLANPIYRTTKRIMSGASVGVAVGSLAVAVGMIAIREGINALQNRIATLEKQATQLNNNDNALIRAGSVKQATYYTSNIFGIKKTSNRR